MSEQDPKISSKKALKVMLESVLQNGGNVNAVVLEDDLSEEKAENYAQKLGHSLTKALALIESS